MKRIAIGIAIFLLGLLLLGTGYGGLTLLRAHGPAPDWNGELSVLGLDGPVEIIRDENGVPHVFAASERDAYFAQGFIHAQDRFWQMAFTRQSQAGRLSEWFGSAMLVPDRVNRRTAGEFLADRLWEDFPAEEKPFVEAYAAGVNAWLDSDNFRLPPEMTLLHIGPRRWEARDSFLVHRSIYLPLSQYGAEVGRARAAHNAASAVAVEWLDGVTNQIAPIIAPDDLVTLEQPTRTQKDGEFSNSWALSGAHTESGLPLLANDPHIPATTPNFWHLMHLSVAGRSIVGVTAPGLPGIMLGHNGSIAWGATAALTDANDVSLVEGDPDDPVRFRRGPEAGWETFTTRNEVIRVRFGNAFKDVVHTSETGFIVPSDIMSLPFTDVPHAQTEYRLAGHDREHSLAAVLRLGRAETAFEGVAALEAFEGPSLNVTIAATDGTIAYVLAGMIAVRPTANATTVDFAPRDDNQWTRLPFAENPKVMNPQNGRIVTANQTVVGPAYSHYLSDMFADPVRADRIHEMLNTGTKHGIDSFHAMQRDSLSPIARELAPLLLQAPPANEQDAAFAQILKDWDYRFDLTATAPIIYLTWAEIAAQKVGGDELGKFARGFSVGDRFLIDVFTGRRAHWCDDITTDKTEGCDEILASALTEARLAVEAAYGPDPARWTWGEVAVARLPHLGFAQLPVLGDMFSQTTPLAAGPEALFFNAVSTDAKASVNRDGFISSYQAIFDLAALDESLFMMAGGQSGHFQSPYYDNLTGHWAAGERFKIPTDRASVTPIATMTLNPNS